MRFLLHFCGWLALLFGVLAVGVDSNQHSVQCLGPLGLWVLVFVVAHGLGSVLGLLQEIRDRMGPLKPER